MTKRKLGIKTKVTSDVSENSYKGVTAHGLNIRSHSHYRFPQEMQDDTCGEPVEPWAALIKAVKKETVLCTGVFTLQEQRDMYL